MNAVPDQLHWKLSGHCDTDLLDLATLADNILLDSKDRRNQHSDHSSNFSSSAFSTTQSQSPPNISKEPLAALQAQMHEMQTSLSRVSRSASPNNHTRLSAAQMSHVSPSFSPPSDAIRHPSPLMSSPSQPRRTRTRVVRRPDRYTP